MRRFLVYITLALALTLSATSQPSDRQIDPQTIESQAIESQAIEIQVLESLAREIGQSLRCVVCQNQSINDSDAPLADDMRKLVRKQLGEGKSKDEIIAYMQENYGDYVLLKPPVQSNTILLWFGPFLLLAGLLFWFIRAAQNESDPT